MCPELLELLIWFWFLATSLLRGRFFLLNISNVADKDAKDGAGSGALQPLHHVRDDEPAGSSHSQTSRHGAAGGKTSSVTQ